MRKMSGNIFLGILVLLFISVVLVISCAPESTTTTSLSTTTTSSTSTTTTTIYMGDVEITFIWTNIPAMRGGTSLGAGEVWMPLLGVITNTNTGGAAVSTNAYAVITGGASYLHISNITWSPAAGKPVTIDGTSAYITITRPSGSAAGISYKMACVLGWSRGEQPNNAYFEVTSETTNVATNIVVYMN